MIKKALWLGTATGLVLGLLLWTVEAVTSVKVYTLLLNIDFIPILGSIAWPIWMEWFFHLVMAWAIALVYLGWIALKTNGESSARWATSLLISVMAGSAYFPLTELAIKKTPPLDDVIAITYWLGAHLIYGASLVILDEWSD